MQGSGGSYRSVRASIPGPHGRTNWKGSSSVEGPSYVDGPSDIEGPSYVEGPSSDPYSAGGEQGRGAVGAADQGWRNDALLPQGRRPQGLFKLPWREAGPPYHHDDKVVSDQ